jgi:hypothetical protein
MERGRVQSTEEVDRGSLESLRRLFPMLAPPEPGALDGVYRAQLTGPSWWQQLSKIVLAPAGLGGWWGKEFDGQGNGKNIVSRGESLERVLPMEVVETISLVDGRQGISLRYPPGSRFPWTWCVDELRQIDEGTLLGMMVVNVGPLRKLAFPFILHRHKE